LRNRSFELCTIPLPRIDNNGTTIEFRENIRRMIASLQCITVPIASPVHCKLEDYKWDMLIKKGNIFDII